MSIIQQLLSDLEAGSTDLLGCLSSRPALSREEQWQLVLADQKYRIQRGEPSSYQHYVQILPWLAEEDSRQSQLIISEFALRLGSIPGDALHTKFLSEYSDAHPTLIEQLSTKLEQWNLQPFTPAQLDAFCDRFEEAVIAGQSPQIEDCLALAPKASHEELLVELLKMETYHLQKRGVPPDWQDYQCRFPGETIWIQQVQQQLEQPPKPNKKGAKAFENPTRNSNPDDLTGTFISTHTADEQSNGRYQLEQNLGQGAYGPVDLAQNKDPKRQISVKVPGSEAQNVKASIKIHNFILDRQVGSGAFGSVFRATRVSDKSVVAIKILKPHGKLTDAIRTRFLREATLLCQLNHPRIIRFRELGIADEQLYLVMDYVESVAWSDLSVTLSKDRLWRLVFQIMTHCLDAVIYLHNQGLVHRDIKPNNLLFERKQNKLKVYLADFGLAKDYLQAGHSGVTSDHEIAGTLGYLAPELLGGVKYYRPESDQYALAATCFAMLSGRPPIDLRESSNALILIRRHQIPRIETLVPTVPSDLADWLHQGLQTDPKKRFASAQEMHQNLVRILAKS
jgi:serine/threonine protein kinase